MKPWKMAALALAALTAACSRPADPFVIPDVQDVAYVSTSQLEARTRTWEFEPRDPERIGPILKGRPISRYRPMDASEREALLALIRKPDPKGRVRISNGQYQ